MNHKVVTIDGYRDVPQEESALLCAVAQQPVSVGIDGRSVDFQLYKGVLLSVTSFSHNSLPSLLSRIPK